MRKYLKYICLSAVTNVYKGLANAFNVEGRATRSEFWWFFIFTNLVTFLAGWVDNGTPATVRFGLYSQLVLWLCLMPFTAVTARRLHDLNFSGVWAWVVVINLMFVITQSNYPSPDEINAGIVIVTIFGCMTALVWIIMLVAFLFPGTHGPNRFGVDALHCTDEDQADYEFKLRSGY